MSVMLYKLRGVEDDEADDIRGLLAEHAIDFYETSNGRWGLGFAAIWLHDDIHFEQGESLIQAYQKQRFTQARERYEQLRVQGKQPTLWRSIKERPVQILVVLLAIFFMALFVLAPFVFI